MTTAAEKTMARDGVCNVFEWCWEHADLPEEERQVLLRLAWHAVGEPCPEIHPVQLSRTDARVNGRLISDGWLALSAQTVRFPAYEAWRAAQ